MVPPTREAAARASPPCRGDEPRRAPPEPPPGPTRRAPLGRVFGARSGDKGGDANVGVWARDDAGYAWLASELDVDRFRELLPETRDLEVVRYAFPQLRAVNFVVTGLLGEGVAASTRFDPQAKALGEWLRSREVELPESLLARSDPGVSRSRRRTTAAADARLELPPDPRCVRGPRRPTTAAADATEVVGTRVVSG